VVYGDQLEGDGEVESAVWRHVSTKQ
jgi:hypothetical protein